MTKPLGMRRFEVELRALCEKHGVALQIHASHPNLTAELHVCFYNENNAEITDPLEDITLVEDRL